MTQGQSSSAACPEHRLSTGAAYWLAGGLGRAGVQAASWSVGPGCCIPVMCLPARPPLPAMWVAACCSGFAACLLQLAHCAVQLPLYQAVRHALWAQRQRQQHP